MRFTKFVTVGLLTLPLLTGCGADEEAVLFVTKTSLGIDFERTPATANIAYSRTEGYIGPVLEDGTLPPVAASLNTNAELWTPKVQQLYATGDAAIAVTTAPDGAAVTTANDEGSETPDCGSDPCPTKLAFFGTTSTIGIKAGFDPAGAPDSFLFGYRRKEASLIPLTKNTQNGVTVTNYPSVLASFDSSGDASAPEKTHLKVRQFFATGKAALALGNNRNQRQHFQAKAEDALVLYHTGVERQRGQALKALSCLPGVPDAKLGDVVYNAIEQGLFHDGADTEGLTARSAQQIRLIYSANISNTVGTDQGRTDRLKTHGDFVCGLLTGNS